MRNPSTTTAAITAAPGARPKARRGRDLRLLVVTPRAFPEVGGVEKHVFETTRRVAAAGVRVTLLTTDLSGELASEETVDDVRIIRLRAAPRSSDYYFAPGVVRRIGALNPDVIHCQSYHTLVCPLAMAAASRARIPYVVSFHSGPHSSRARVQLRGLQHRTLGPLLRRAARLICVSQFERSVFVDALGLPAERFDVIPNGCDLPDPGDVEMPPQPVIASIGRLERYKGHQRLIAALPHILPRIPDARALIVGHGPYRSELVAQSRELGVADAVEFRSVAPDDRLGMARLMRQASLVVQLSDYESGGIAAIEAAGVGTAVLVRRVAALCDVAASGFAESVAPDAGGVDIADAVVKQLREGEPRRRPLDIPTWDECAEKLLTVYRSVDDSKVARTPGWSPADTDRPLHVTMATARFLPERGGTELHTYEVARRLARHNVKVTVLTTALSGPFPREAFAGDVRIIRVRAWPPRRDYYLAPNLIRTIRRGETDILHCQGYHTFVAPLAMVAALSAGIPYVVTLHSGGHSSRVRRALRPVQAWALRPLLRRAQQLIAVSDFEAGLFARRTRLPIDSFAVIPSGVDLPATPSEPAGSTPPLIISIGRLERYKGHHRVVEALPALLRTRPGARLRIVGSGPFEPELRRLAERLGVSDLVEIAPVPAEPREKMARLLHRAACVVMLSDYESQGLAVQEALALGRPLVMSDLGALAHVGEHPNVRRLGRRAGREEIAAAITELLDAPPVTPPRLPTWDECTNTLLDVYREARAARPNFAKALTRTDSMSSLVPPPGDAGFEPVRILDVELSERLPVIDASTPSGTRYRHAVTLVRLHSRPLRLAKLSLDGGQLGAAELAERLWPVVHGAVNEHLGRDGLPPVSKLPITGLEDGAAARCIAQREEALARAPFASVVIPTRDRAHSLRTCLDSLRGLDYPSYEIVVVDNCPSDDRTERLVRGRYGGGASPRVRYVRQDGPVANARNRGLAEAAGSIVAFTDDDVVVDRWWLLELVRGFSTERVACVTGMILPVALETQAQAWLEQYGGFTKGFQERMFDLHENRPDTPLFPYAAGMFGSGASMAFRTEVLRRLGGFDTATGPGTRARGGEDLAAFFDVIAHGHTLAYAPAAILYHRHRKDYDSLRTQAYSYGVGLAAYLTRTVVNEPRRLVDVARRLPHGLAHMLSPTSEKNINKGANYPRELSRLERRGFLHGPLAYLRARRESRRLRHGTANPIRQEHVPQDPARKTHSLG